MIQSAGKMIPGSCSELTIHRIDPVVMTFETKKCYLIDAGADIIDLELANMGRADEEVPLVVNIMTDQAERFSGNIPS